MKNPICTLVNLPNELIDSVVIKKVNHNFDLVNFDINAKLIKLLVDKQQLNDEVLIDILGMIESWIIDNTKEEFSSYKKRHSVDNTENIREFNKIFTVLFSMVNTDYSDFISMINYPAFDATKISERVQRRFSQIKYNVSQMLKELLDSITN